MSKLETRGDYTHAVMALRRDFLHEDAEGPKLAAAFLNGSTEERLRLRAELTTVARFLLGE